MALSLYDILYNPLLLHLIAPYLSLGDKCAILQTCKDFRALFLDNGSLFSYFEPNEAVQNMLAAALWSSEKTKDVNVEASSKISMQSYFLRLSSSPDYNLAQLGEHVILPPSYMNSIKSSCFKFHGFPSHQGTYKTDFTNMLDSFKGEYHRYLQDWLSEDLSYMHLIIINAIFNVKIDHSQLLQFVRVLVLDDIWIPVEQVVCDVLQLVSQTKSRLSLLSVRNSHSGSGLYRLGSFDEIIDLSRGTLQSSESSQPPLGIYFWGASETTGPSIRKRALRVNEEDEGIKEASIDGRIANSTEGDDLEYGCSSTIDKWYKSYGNMTRIMNSNIDGRWTKNIYQLCNHNTLGLRLAFDAVLCRGPRHDKTWAETAARGHSSTIERSLCFLSPKIAVIALGPDGCVSCGTSPEGPASYQSSPVAHLPLLAPIPRVHGTSVRDAQRPPPAAYEESNTGEIQRDAKLIVRCYDCLEGRWCERCNRWWCENCFPGRPVECDQPNHLLYSYEKGFSTIYDS